MGQELQKQQDNNQATQQQQTVIASANLFLGKIPIQPVPGSRGLRVKRHGIVSVYCQKNRQIYDIRLTPGLTVGELKEILTAKVDQKIFPRHVKLYIHNDELDNSLKLIEVIKNKNLLRMEISDPTDNSVMEHSLMNIVLQSQKGEVRYQYSKKGPLNQLNKSNSNFTSTQKDERAIEIQKNKTNGNNNLASPKPQQNLANELKLNEVTNSTSSLIMKLWNIDFSVFRVPELRISPKLLRKNKMNQTQVMNTIESQGFYEDTQFDQYLDSSKFVIQEMEEEETGKHSFANQS